MKTLSHNFGKSGTSSHKLTALAYRNGTSSVVAQTISSQHHKRHYDAVLAKSSDLKLYQDMKDMDEAEQYMLGFPLLKGEDPEAKRRAANPDEDHSAAEVLTHQEILEKHVYPITQAQGGADWWMMRDNVITSHSSDSVIRATAKFITPDHELRNDYECVLKYANLLHLLPSDDDVDDKMDGDTPDIPGWFQKECERMATERRSVRQRKGRRKGGDDKDDNNKSDGKF